MRKNSTIELKLVKVFLFCTLYLVVKFRLIGSVSNGPARYSCLAEVKLLKVLVVSQLNLEFLSKAGKVTDLQTVLKSPRCLAVCDP